MSTRPSFPPAVIRAPLMALALVIATTTPCRAQTDCHDRPCIDGILLGRSVNTRAPESWLAGEFGRLTTGVATPGETSTFVNGQLHLSVDWSLSSQIRLYAQGTARYDPDVLEETTGGLTEAYADFAFPSADSFHRLRVRAGLFLLPTSHENTGPLWSSPYTLTWSALNSWIAEEVRPVGIDADYRFVAGSQLLSIGGTAFRGNDTSGTLLAWRGWSFGDRLSSWNEVVPLPPLESLGTTGLFSRQRDDGTKPIGSDLDGSTGLAARARWQLPERASVQLTWIDNKGDRRLYKGEYAWETYYWLAGFDWSPVDRFTILGEYGWGETGMGFAPRFVQADWDAGYLMASVLIKPVRLSIRYDDFSVTDRDGVAEDATEDGTAWTAAILWELGVHWRLGVEYLDVDATRPALLEAGVFDETTRSLTTELRYSF